MKTAISIPDEVFRTAERTARRLRITRSELYARAVAEFVEAYGADEITKALDRLYGEVDSKPDRDLAAAQFRSLGEEDW